MISRGDASTSLIKLDKSNKNLRPILQHFASFYSVNHFLYDILKGKTHELAFLKFINGCKLLLMCISGNNFKN